jgi:hypothetical protein
MEDGTTTVIVVAYTPEEHAIFDAFAHNLFHNRI